MTRNVKGFCISIASACVALTVLCSLFLLFLVYTKSTQADSIKEDIPYEGKFIPSKKENLKFLLLASDESGNLPLLTELVYYNAPAGIYYTIFFPPETLCDVENRSKTLQGHYEYEGISGAIKAVNSLFEQDIDRYVRIDKNGMANLIDFMGGVEYTIPDEILIAGEKFSKGEQLLDGRRASHLLLFGNQATSSDGVQISLTQSLYQSRMKKRLAEQYDKLSSRFFSLCESNLNQYDFALRQGNFTNYLREETLKSKVFLLNGNYDSTLSAFIPDQNSLRELKAVLNGTTEELIASESV